MNRRTSNAITVTIAPTRINQVDAGPLPRIIGIGPIRISTPPLVVPCACVNEATAINIMPIKIMAKLANRIQEMPMGNVPSAWDRSVIVIG